MRFYLRFIAAFVVIIYLFVIFGLISLPHNIKERVDKELKLTNGTEIRKLFVKTPFALDFNVYIFNVTNPDEVSAGGKPRVAEIGPFCFKEWKEKVDVDDYDIQDLLSYRHKDTFFKSQEPGCLSGEERVTIPHPLILGMVNTVLRTTPKAIGILSKAVKGIFPKQESLFISVRAMDLLFDGVIIDCNVTGFAPGAICSKLKSSDGLQKIDEHKLAFSFMAAKNATPGKIFTILQGRNSSQYMGKIIEYDDKKRMDIWSTNECNKIYGTDGTIFQPFMNSKKPIVSFSPDLCRTLSLKYEKSTKFDGLKVGRYGMSFGDMSTDEDLRCYCSTPTTCLKQGMMDLYKCVGVPIYVSLPHFYDCDPIYLDPIKGLKPIKDKHAIIILFEMFTGSPLMAKKRLMFSMPMQAVPNMTFFHRLPSLVFPIFWVEEGVALNDTFTHDLKVLFKIKKTLAFVSYTCITVSVVGLIAASFLFYRSQRNLDLKVEEKAAENKDGNELPAVPKAEINKLF